MLLEDDLRQLLKVRTESKNLDYKEAFNWATASKDDKHEIVKDILAMANTLDGGKIVFGVRDSDFDPVGLKKEDFESFDTTKVNDLLHKFTEPKHTCQVSKQQIDGKYFVVIDVPEFQEVPIICKNDAFSKTGNPQKQILRRGQIYIRTEKASTEQILAVDEMRVLLGIALTRKGDELLNNVRRLMTGKPLHLSEESERSYAEEIRDANEFITEKIGSELKQHEYWEVCCYPVDFNPKRFDDRKAIKDLLEKSTVRLTGWDFPYTDFSENTRNFSKGRQSFTTKWYIEAHRAYQSGLFLWRQVFWEDVRETSEDGKRVLSFSGAIWLITMFFLFFKRYYENIAMDSSLQIKILLHGCKERKLVSFERGIFLKSWSYSSEEEVILFEENIKVVDVKASYKEIANRAVRTIFAMFNWDRITEETITRWQEKLFKEVV